MEMKGIGEEPETLASKHAAALRNTKQEILPAEVLAADVGGYRIYPAHALGSGKIYYGYDTLAQWVVEQKTVVIDGYVGNFWDVISARLTTELEKLGVRVNWLYMKDFLKPEAEIDRLVAPFL